MPGATGGAQTYHSILEGIANTTTVIYVQLSKKLLNVLNHLDIAKFQRLYMTKCECECVA